jgi:pyridoxamine 5'-phosphate oxidase
MDGDPEELPGDDPFDLFQRWLGEALLTDPDQAVAMTLATATPDGMPSARTVLLRGFDDRGFVFFTNYRSQKSRELEANPRAAVVLNWPGLHRQVRASGTVGRLDREESEAYFRNRPRGHRLSAWASPQSEPIPDRATLERRFAEVEERFRGREVPLPEHWGGFLLVPDEFEFWSGREDRLHDRFRYARRPDGSWAAERLAP